MNRRARSSHRSATPNQSSPFLKFLKPGALAQIRDSRRITTSRSNRINLISQIRPISPSSSDSVSPHITVAAASDAFPCFSGRIYGPRFLQRKKLVAGKSVMFLRAPLSPVLSDSLEPIIDLFGSDILTNAAH